MNLRFKKKESTWNRPRRECFLLTVLGVLFLLSCPGCGDSGVERETVSGMVTFNGKPVPFGMIYFSPDIAQGGRGPQGFAQIDDGKYRTDDTGRGAIAGPVIVEISGYPEKKNINAEYWGKPMFPKYRTHAEIKPGMGSLDIEVPSESTATP